MTQRILCLSRGHYAFVAADRIMYIQCHTAGLLLYMTDGKQIMVPKTPMRKAKEMFPDFFQASEFCLVNPAMLRSVKRVDGWKCAIKLSDGIREEKIVVHGKAIAALRRLHKAAPATSKEMSPRQIVEAFLTLDPIEAMELVSECEDSQDQAVQTLEEIVSAAGNALAKVEDALNALGKSEDRKDRE